MKVIDPILGKSNLNPEKLAAQFIRQGAHRSEFLTEYLVVGDALCDEFGFNFEFYVAQAHLECGGFTSEDFDKYGNTVGLGHTDSQNLSLTYRTGTEIAYGHLIHLWIYTKGPIPSGHRLEQWKHLDPRYQAVIDAGWAGTVKVIDDLTGKWASKSSTPDYGARIVKRAAEIFGGEAMDSTATNWVFDRVPMPNYVDRTEAMAINGAWDDLGIRDWLGAVVWHTMYGTLWGTDEYFQNEARFKALTDFGVGTLAIDGEDDDGKILMWNNPSGRRTPHASGPVNNPIDDGLAFYNRYGRNAVNKNAVSIERSGNGNTPLSAKCRSSIIRLTVKYADKYARWLQVNKGYTGFNPDVFPLIPNEGRSFIMWHGEINGGKRDTCPGQVVMSETGGMIREAKQLWWNYANPGTTIPETSTYARPVPAKDGHFESNSALFIDINDQKFTLAREVTPRLWALRNAPPTGAPLKPGQLVTASHIVTSSDGATWLVLTDGSRIPAIALVKRS